MPDAVTLWNICNARPGIPLISSPGCYFHLFFGNFFFLTSTFIINDFDKISTNDFTVKLRRIRKNPNPLVRENPLTRINLGIIQFLHELIWVSYSSATTEARDSGYGYIHTNQVVSQKTEKGEKLYESIQNFVKK